MPETYLQRASRHIRDRDFSPRTIIRGVRQGAEQLWLFHAMDKSLQLNEVRSNFMGVAGLNVSNYTFSYGRWLRFGGDHVVPLRVYDFPPGTEIKLYVEPDYNIRTKDYLSRVSNGIGSFTGPTFLREGLPNNGFYWENEIDQVKFEDTNPSGQRRGAFGLTKNGQLILMDDKTKWDIVRSAFKGYEALIGTPFYFSMSDSINDRAIFDLEWKNILSYLFQYQTHGGSTRTGFALSKGFVSRVAIKKVLDHYMQSVKGYNYLALEMEYLNADCIIRNPDGEVDYFSGVGFYRRDHYILVPNRT